MWLKPETRIWIGEQGQEHGDSAAQPQYVEGSTALHRCVPDDLDLCSCIYDPACTGRESYPLVRLPRWLARLRWPRRYVATRRARRILQANGAWRER